MGEIDEDTEEQNQKDGSYGGNEFQSLVPDTMDEPSDHQRLKGEAGKGDEKIDKRLDSIPHDMQWVGAGKGRLFGSSMRNGSDLVMRLLALGGPCRVQ